jgi:hypothetical protein
MALFPIHSENTPLIEANEDEKLRASPEYHSIICILSQISRNVKGFFLSGKFGFENKERFDCKNPSWLKH